MKRPTFNSHSRFSVTRELKINDAATPRRGVNMYDKEKVFLEFDVGNDRLKLALIDCK